MRKKYETLKNLLNRTKIDLTYLRSRPPTEEVLNVIQSLKHQLGALEAVQKKDETLEELELINHSLSYLNRHPETPRLLEAILELEARRAQIESILYRRNKPLDNRQI